MSGERDEGAEDGATAGDDEGAAAREDDGLDESAGNESAGEETGGESEDAGEEDAGGESEDAASEEADRESEDASDEEEDEDEEDEPIDQLGIPMRREPTLDDVRGDGEKHRQLAVGCSVLVSLLVLAFWLVRGMLLSG